jgi:hypothetical protein
MLHAATVFAAPLDVGLVLCVALLIYGVLEADEAQLQLIDLYHPLLWRQLLELLTLL